MFQAANTTLPAYLKTILLFMGFQSEDDLRRHTIDEIFFAEMNETARRILTMDTELSHRFRAELMQEGQDHQAFKLLSGHKNKLQGIKTTLSVEEMKRKDEKLWSEKIKILTSSLFKSSEIEIHPVIWESEKLCNTKCPFKTCKKTLKLRKYYDPRNIETKWPYAVHNFKQHLITHEASMTF